jgi:hypothetical protein
MINQGNDVPDKTIAVFTDPFRNRLGSTEKDRLGNIIEKSSKKRNWFTPHFYRCLPLSIGNQYGYVIKSEFDFSFVWDGTDGIDAIKFYFSEESENIFPRIESHFGFGIITINPPFWLKTPPGVNLMTINPPNHIIPNITVMTGVVETDNIRRNFGFNLKIQMPNIEVFIPAGTPIAAFIPIPRYYADSFELKSAEDIFTQDIIDEEIQANLDVELDRELVEPFLPNAVGRQYLLGKDIYGNNFPDHQKS